MDSGEPAQRLPHVWHCNNVASTIARESHGGVYMHAGPEIGVAATKSFISQLVILMLIGLLLGRMRHLSTAEGSRIIEAIEQVLKLSDSIKSRLPAVTAPKS